MELKDKVIVITGGGSGIGAAMARRFAVEKPAGIVVGDLDGEAAEQVAEAVGGLGLRVDVSTEAGTATLIDSAREAYGPVDLFCANAGIVFEGDVDLPDSQWERMWGVNFMAHVYAARHLVPEWKSRGGGYLVVTASAAGLLTSLGSAPYAVTKHAAVAFAEWVAITHGGSGIGVSVLCPQGVKTAMIEGDNALSRMLMPGAVEPDQVAEDVVAGIRDERFLILPHPEVEQYFQNKAGDYDRWLNGMRKLQSQVDTWSD
jgi:NAD(P)-dependent dehydrogenase (short-subunit alcohol dehydrogenase family)